MCRHGFVIVILECAAIGAGRVVFRRKSCAMVLCTGLPHAAGPVFCICANVDGCLSPYHKAAIDQGVQKQRWAHFETSFLILLSSVNLHQSTQSLVYHTFAVSLHCNCGKCVFTGASVKYSILFSVGLALPYVHFMFLIWVVFEIFTPILGRSGTEIPPDVVLASLITIGTFLLSSYFVSYSIFEVA